MIRERASPAASADTTKIGQVQRVPKVERERRAFAYRAPTVLADVAVAQQHAPRAALRAAIDLVCLELRQPFGRQPLDVGAVDSRVLQGVLSAHRLLALLEPRLRNTPGLSEDVLAVARAHRHAQALRELRLGPDLAVLSQSLGGLLSGWAVVKGPAVAHALYPDPLLRESVDVDVVVDGRDIGLALKSLEDSGARLLTRNWRQLEQARAGELAVLLPYGTLLDLHWSLSNSPVLREQRHVVPTMLSQASSLDSGKGLIPVLSAVDQLLHLCFHAYLGGGRRLSWLLDIKLAAEHPEVDAAALYDRAREFGLTAPTGLMLLRVQRVLGLEVAPELLPRLAPTGAWAVRASEVLWPPLVREARGAGRSGSRILWGSRRTIRESLRALPTVLLPMHSGAIEALLLDVPDKAARERWLQAAAT